MERTYNYEKEHRELDIKFGKVYCTHCMKVILEECEEDTENLRNKAPLMAIVWARENLPCRPYKNPDLTNLREEV